MAAQVLLNWTYNNPDHTGFLLQRSINSGSTWPLSIRVKGNEYQYTDNDAWVYGTFWYRVAPSNPFGVGTFSNTASAYITASGPVTLSLTFAATPDAKPYDGTTASLQTPYISNGALAPGDTSASLEQFFTDVLVQNGVTIVPTGSVVVISDNMYEFSLVNTTGSILGPSGSNDYIIVPSGTDVPASDGWFLDIQDLAQTGSFFYTQEYNSGVNEFLTMTSSNGTNWGITTTNNLRLFSKTFAIGNGRIVAIGSLYADDEATIYLGNYVGYSDDFGMTWSSSSLDVTPNPDNVWCLIWDGTRFIAGANSGSIMISSNGVSWSYQNTGGGEDVRRLHYNTGSGRYIAVGPALTGGWPIYTSTGTIYTSTDAVSWTPVSASLPVTQGYYDVDYSPTIGAYLAVGDEGLMATSSNGINWDIVPIAPIFLWGRALWSVAWNESRSFFTVSDTQGYIYTSTNAIDWELNQINAQGSYSGSSYSNVIRMKYAPAIQKVFVFGTAPPS